MTPDQIADIICEQRNHMLEVAAELENGKLKRYRIKDTGRVDVSEDEAADLRARADSLSATIAAFERLAQQAAVEVPARQE